MDKPSLVYVTFIAAAQEKVWNALIDPEITKHYWSNHRNKSSWNVGDTWTHEDYDDADVDIFGTVLESTPPSHLVLSWADGDDVPETATYSRVTFDLETMGDATKLTVIHDGLAADSQMFRGVSRGWPMVLSSLKTMLETGKPLVLPMKAPEAQVAG